MPGGGEDVFWECEIRELGERDVDGEGEMVGDVLGCGEDGPEEVSGELTVRPDFSVRGMNSSGGTRPRSGFCQRARASNPWSKPVRSSTSG